MIRAIAVEGLALDDQHASSLNHMRAWAARTSCDGLTSRRVVLHEPFEGVDTSESDALLLACQARSAILLAPRLLPGSDLATQPEQCTPPAAIQDRTWHVGVSALIHVDRVRLGEPQDGRHLMGIGQVIDIDGTSHVPSLEDTAPI